MSEKTQTDGQIIAKEFYYKITSLLEKETSWWSVAAGWENGEYGKTIEYSLEIAREILNPGSQTNLNPEEIYNNFSRSIVSLLNISKSIDKSSMMIGKIFSL